MKQTVKALMYLLALALSLAPVLVLVTLPLLLITKAKRMIQHEEKTKKLPQQNKTVLVTGAPHTKVSLLQVMSNNNPIKIISSFRAYKCAASSRPPDTR